MKLPARKEEMFVLAQAVSNKHILLIRPNLFCSCKNAWVLQFTYIVSVVMITFFIFRTK
jgi:hypothetical protein